MTNLVAALERMFLEADRNGVASDESITEVHEQLCLHRRITMNLDPHRFSLSSKAYVESVNELEEEKNRDRGYREGHEQGVEEGREQARMAIDAVKKIHSICQRTVDF